MSTTKKHHPFGWCYFWHSLTQMHQGTGVDRPSLYRLSVAKEVAKAKRDTSFHLAEQPLLCYIKYDEMRNLLSFICAIYFL